MRWNDEGVCEVNFGVIEKPVPTFLIPVHWSYFDRPAIYSLIQKVFVLKSQLLKKKFLLIKYHWVCSWFVICISEEVKKAWDEHKSVAQNLAEMGLSADPNKTLRILSTKVFLHDCSCSVMFVLRRLLCLNLEVRNKFSCLGFTSMFACSYFGLVVQVLFLAF